MSPLAWAFDAMKRRCGGSVATLPLAFLYVCENEGLSVHELALAAGLTDSTASRAARALAEPDVGLAEIYVNAGNGAMLSVWLTPAGTALRDELDGGLARFAQQTRVQPGDGHARRRSHVLSALEAFRSFDATVTLTKLLAFLVVRDRPGVDLAGLAQALHASKVTASRAVRAWLANDEQEDALPPAAGLLEMWLDPRNNRRRLFQPAPAGLDFKVKLDRILAAGVPLRR